MDRRNWSFILSVITAALAALFLCLQVVEWKASGHDYTMLTAQIIVTALLWMCLLAAIVSNWRDAGRARHLRAEIVSLKNEWGNQIQGLHARHRAEVDSLNAQHLRDLQDARLKAEEDCRRAVEAEEVRWRELAAIDHGKQQAVIDELKARLRERNDN